MHHDHPAARSTPARRLILAVATLLPALALGAAPDASPKSGPVLHLANGGFVAGNLIDSPGGEALRWRSPAFVAPLEFATAGVGAIHWPPPAQLPAPRGEYGFELAGGDLIFGELAALDDQAAEVVVPLLGRLHIDRANVHRIFRRREGADTLYSGPNGLVGWAGPNTPDAWREESGQPLTDKPGAILRGDLGLPARAVVEFVVSWKGKPDFVFALGAGEGDKSLRKAFRFEVWDGELIVGRESGTSADLAPLRPVAEGPGRVHLMAYLDQEKGQLLVVSPAGKTLAKLTVPDDGPGKHTLPGLALINTSGDVRLENLRIGRWDGTPPVEAEADRSRIHRVDGSIAYGHVDRYDAEAGAFVLRDEAGESRVTRDQIADIFLSGPAEGPARSIRAVYSDGTRLSGSLRKVEGEAIAMEVPGIREPLSPPIQGLRSLLVLNAAPAAKGEGDHHGVLELEGVRLPGFLADAPAGADGGSLQWRADGSPAASPIRPEAFGQVVYKEPKPAAPPVVEAPRPAPRGGLRVLGLALDRLTAAAPPKPEPTRLALHLRTGDVIPCEVTTIDEEGVRFKSSLSPSTFVPHAKVKAVELAPVVSDAIKLSKPKRERVLTLPRMQRDSPPTQVVRSTNGDFLRARVVGMDAETLKVETRLEPKAIPRGRIARIIWFHADEFETPKPDDKAKVEEKPKEKPEPDASQRVQAVRSDGIRLTFRPSSCEGGVLKGESDVLGACNVELAAVDQLIVGRAIEQAASQLTYGRWVLQHAEDPKFAQAGSEGESSGTESPMVGKPAPDFELELLEGKKFHLADSKGHVVVLDFWATWCGPCIQAMPQVERVAKEFRDKGVQLVAVNLEEAPRDIRAMLERHKLDVTVALDRDGVVADKYGATAIPQTVIIDREGKVARLFVGGGNGLEDQLREALNKLEGIAPAAPPKE